MSAAPDSPAVVTIEAEVWTTDKSSSIKSASEIPKSSLAPTSEPSFKEPKPPDIDNHDSSIVLASASMSYTPVTVRPLSVLFVNLIVSSLLVVCESPSVAAMFDDVEAYCHSNAPVTETSATA